MSPVSGVHVRDLTVRIDGREIVSSVSFSLAPGTITALVGESGSGKTTTALSLLDEAPPGAAVSGTVEIEGAARRAGYVPQHPSTALNPVRRIGPVLEEIARLHVTARSRRERRDLVRERVSEALQRAQLPDGVRLLRRFPHQLSGGQQQRVVLAHALIGRPGLLIADEPTTGQDAITRGEIAEELRTVAQDGVTVLLLTHDLQLVRMIADHIMVMRHGKVVESGSSTEVLEAPRHPYTRRLVAATLTDTSYTPEPTASEPLLSAEGLGARQRHDGRYVDVLTDVDLMIHTGDRMAVVGRSGSGKTTLARCLAGLHPFNRGELRLDGEPLSPQLRRRSREQLAHVQYVFQDARASFSEFTPVIDQVARTAQRLRGLDRTSAHAAATTHLARLGVSTETAAKPPTALSGGELQRAALVRATLAEPRLLICDEITSGLDASTRADLLEVLGQIQEETGCALVLITHDLDVVARFADRVVEVDSGRVSEGPLVQCSS